MARRRRKSGFSSAGRFGPARLALPIILGIAAIFGFISLVRLGDSVSPPQQETRIALPDAFKDAP